MITLTKPWFVVKECDVVASINPDAHSETTGLLFCEADKSRSYRYKWLRSNEANKYLFKSDEGNFCFWKVKIEKLTNQ
jgi:hypothetical protein